MSNSENQAASDSHVRFPTTSWTLVCNLQQLSAEHRQELLNDLLRRYWKPLYAYFRSKRKPPEQSADLVQGFLQRFLEGDKVLQADQPEKRFRDWLMVSARNYLVSVHRQEAAAKRRPVNGLVSFEALRSEDGDAYEPTGDDTPESAYLEAWRRGLIDRAMRLVAEESSMRGRNVDFQIFCDYYISERPASCTWQDLACKYGFNDWRDAARKADWVKAQFARIIRREIRKYVDSDTEIDGEIRELLR